jgi:hypothetical protein
MTGEELAARIRFVVDQNGTITSVVVSPEAWRELVARIEEAEDRELLSKLAPRLAAGPKGALRWEEVERDWE